MDDLPVEIHQIHRPLPFNGGNSARSGEACARLTLRLGAVQESINVEGASPQISYDSHTVDGVITGSEIQNLP